MARIEWAARSGEEVETVISNLMYNWNSRSQRIRPTQGDYGIDVLIPAGEATNSWDVYQIKKYATNLDASQKDKVVGSFARMLIGIVRENLPVRNWYLVMPLDPTLPGREKWFAGVPEAAIKKYKKDSLTDAEEAKARAWLDTPDRRIEWKGIAFCEYLAAEYPRVSDYYLHGGVERVRAAVDSMAALLHGDQALRTAAREAAPGEGATALIEPSEVIGTLQTLVEVLDTDPHYRYGHSVGPNEPLIEPEPDLVAATIKRLPNGDFLAFKIYQRSAQSLEERPIPIKVEFKFEDGSQELEDLRAWQRYGKPFQAGGSFSLDLPGGLGGSSDNGKVSVPAPHLFGGHTLRMQVVDPEGGVLGAVSFHLQSTASEDRKGAWTSGYDPSGYLFHEGYYDLVAPNHVHKFGFSLAPILGAVAAEIRPAIEFARHLEAPNSLQIAGEYGPFRTVASNEGNEGLVPPWVAKFVKALTIIQARTSKVIQIPELSDVPSRDLRQVERVADLLEGGTRVVRWENVKSEGVPARAVAVGEHHQLWIEANLWVQIDGERLIVGGVKQIVDSAVVRSVEGSEVTFEPGLNSTMYESFIDSPDFRDAPVGMTTVRARRLPDLLELREEE